MPAAVAEVGLEDVEGLLRLDSRDVEGVRGLAAPHPGDAEDGDGQHGPGEQNEAASADRGAAEPVQEGGHVDTMWHSTVICQHYVKYLAM